MALFGNLYLHREGQGKAQFGIPTCYSDWEARMGKDRVWEHSCIDPLSQAWLKLTHSPGRTRFVEGKKQWQEVQIIIQRGLSKAQRRHLDQEGAHFLDPQTCTHPTATWSWFCGQSSHALVSTLSEKFEALQTWREGTWAKFIYGWDYETMSGKRFWLWGKEGWVQVWAEADPDSHFIQGAKGHREL